MLRRILPALVICPLVLGLGAAPALAQVRTELVASGFSQPIAFVQDPADSTVQVVAQQNGHIRVLKSGVVQAADYLDLSGIVTFNGEQGLLGFAFAPDYGTSGRVFAAFNNLNGHTVVARFIRSAGNPLRAELSSRFDFMWPGGQRQIVRVFGNHNGGNLAFGGDGFLYIGFGDGGDGNDPTHNAQNPQTLLGKMVRLDTSVADSDPEGYNVPATNPFVGQAGILAEIWSFGWRNPWRWSFDNPARGGTGAMVVADVGQNAWEEVDYEPAGRGGRNYGWRNREGAHDNVTSLPAFSQPLTDPILEYSHADGRSITGGFVYRGSSLGLGFRGRYVYADFITSRVWSVLLTINAVTGNATASNRIEHTAELGTPATTNPASFGQDAAGELYLVSYAGSVYRLVGTNPPATGGRRRPAAAPITGVAVLRNSLSAPTAATTIAPAAKLEVRRSNFVLSRSKIEIADVPSCAAIAHVVAVIRALSAREPDEAMAVLIALYGADVVGGDGLRCFFRRDFPGADDLAFRNFTLRGGDGLERLDHTREAPPHQLRGPKTRHDRELELIHLNGAIDHGPSTRLRPSMP